MFVTSKVPRCTELNSSTKITRDNLFKFMLREKCLLEIRRIFPIPGRLVYLRSCPAVSSSADNYLQFSGFILSRFKSWESSSFASKDNFFCLSSKLILVQLHSVLFMQSVLLSFQRKSFVGGAYEGLSSSARGQVAASGQVATNHSHW